MNDKRKSLEYKAWRDKVKRRDGNACRKCGFEKNLEVHHIKPLKKYPQFGLVLDNGLTLCGNCHSLLKGKEETENLRTFLRNDTKINRQLQLIEGSFSKYLESKLKSRSQRTRDEAVSELFSHLDVYPNSLREMLPLLVYVADSSNWADEHYSKHKAIEWLKREAEKENQQKVQNRRKWEVELEDRKKTHVSRPNKNIGARNHKTLYYMRKKTHVSCPNKNCQRELRIPETQRRSKITCGWCNTRFEYKMGVVSETPRRTQDVTAKEAVKRYERRVQQKQIEAERIKREEQLRREAEQRAAQEKREQEIISQYGSLEEYEHHLKRQKDRGNLIFKLLAWGFWGAIGLFFLNAVSNGCQ